MGLDDAVLWKERVPQHLRDDADSFVSCLKRAIAMYNLCNPAVLSLLLTHSVNIWRVSLFIE
jgi:hypothetical protein